VLDEGCGRLRVNDRERGRVCEYDRRCDRAYASVSFTCGICSGEPVCLVDANGRVPELEREERADFDLATGIRSGDPVLGVPSESLGSNVGDGGRLTSVELPPGVTSE